MSAPYYQDSLVTIYCGDCEEILPTLEVQPDLLLSDPPYGSKLSTAFHERFTHKAGKWWKNTNRETVTRHAPVAGDEKPFDPSHLFGIAPKMILWGANWYVSRLPDSGGWLVWDKRHKVEDAEWPMSEGELAWTNCLGSVRFFRHMWFGLLRESEKGQHFHPTQKPAALAAWCMTQAKLAPNSLILDPYAGAGWSIVAAKNNGHRAIGIELKEQYCEIAAERCRQEVLDLGGVA
jgi:site-specific DNA-methyltransferase (adenine-specific)